MTWKPGQSGNPSGRRKSTKEQLEALSEARKGSAKAMRQAIKMLDDEDMKTRLAAMKLVLEYGLGKPTQTVDMTTHAEPVEEMPRAEQIQKLRAAADALEADGEGMH